MSWGEGLGLGKIGKLSLNATVGWFLISGGGVGIGAITDAGSGTWGQGVVGLPQCMRGAEVGGKP